MAGGAEQVHRVDLQPPVVGGALEGRAHGEVLEGVDDAEGVLLLEARHQGPVRGEVALGGVEVDDQEDPAEQLEQVFELLR